MKKITVSWILIFTLAILLSISESALAAAPSNDNCSGAQAVGDVTNLSFDTSESTFDGPGHYIDMGGNVWYVYTASCTGCATVSLCGSSFDTMMAVYDGSSCYPAIEDLLISNDDYCGHQSQVNFPVTSGNKYLIEIGGYYGWTGAGNLTISCSSASCQPNNDYCYNAEPIFDVNNKAFSTNWATPDGPAYCMDGKNIWYCYTSLYSGDVTVSLCGSSYNTSLAIYDGCGCYPDESDLIDCNHNSCRLQSEITFTATAGHQYLIEVGGRTGRDDYTGHGVLSISSGGQTCPPVNNDCVNAQSIGNVTDLPFDTTCATADGSGICMTSPNIWYCYTAPCTDEVTVSLCGSSFDTVLAIYDECDCYPTSSSVISCNDDYCSQQSEITFSATAGHQYLIEVGGFSSETGQGILNISCDSSSGTVNNDYCYLAQAIGNVTNLAFNTTNATFDGTGICMTSKNIWYVYNATCTGDATVSLCGSSFDTKLAVYSSTTCYPSSSSLVGCNDDACGYQSELTFPVMSGEQFLIEVGGYGSYEGQGVITVTCEGTSVEGKSDLGDAPDSSNTYSKSMTAYPKGGPSGVQARYPTVYGGTGSGPYGPIHTNSELVAYLGENISHETEADNGYDEDGVNNIRPLQNSPDRDKEDDGVIFPINMPSCRWTTFDYLVNVVTPGTDLWVNVWFDWNRDGDWDDDTSTDPALVCSSRPVSEWAVQNQLLFDLPVGAHQITTPAFLSWHEDDSEVDNIWMRITLSEEPWKGGNNPGITGNGGSGPQAGYLIGETEDYYFVPNVECDICEDMNGDGIIDMNDLTIIVNNWMACCK
jgi:hypothetical protein